LVIAPDPKTCSEIVWWLRDLMRPASPRHIHAPQTELTTADPASGRFSAILAHS
jgi:hypothetical protein